MVTINVTTEVNISVNIVRLPGELVAGGSPVPVFRVDVRNDGPSAAAGLLIRQESLFPLRITLYNATGTDQLGRSFLLFNQPLPAGESVELIAEYFRPSLDPDFDPAYTIDVLLSPEDMPDAADIGI